MEHFWASAVAEAAGGTAQQGVRGIDGGSLAGKDSSSAESSRASRCSSQSFRAADFPATGGDLRGPGLDFLVMRFDSTSQGAFYMLLWSGGTPGGSVAAPSASFTSSCVPTP